MQIICDLYSITFTGSYYYLDFNKWFFCVDLFDSHLLICIDSLALICAALVLFLTIVALFFGVEYMNREAFINRLLYLLNLFATSVIFLFFCFDFFLIMLAWEFIGLFSLLLVNFYSNRIYTLKAALKTFIFSRISDFFMFLAFILSILIFHSTDLTLIFLQAPFLLFHYIYIGPISVHFLSLFALSIVLSGVIKAAQFFSHVWLPDAMEAPTPASALIHSSTLVVAGVFLVIRFATIFEFTPEINYFLAILGAITLAFASITAVFQNDIKKLVAYSTISQIGYLVCGLGFCCYEEVLIYLIMHALNKAFLFILVGYIVHFFSGNTDLRQMGGLYLYSFDISVLFFGVSLNLAGLPYTAGFFAKEFLLFQVCKDDFLSLLVRSCWFISFIFTPIYMLLIPFIVIFGTKKGVISNYKSLWSLNNNQYINSNLILLNFYKTNALRWFLQRLQLSLLTSRLTIYILITFWLLFFNLGEIFLMIIFNYSTLLELTDNNIYFKIAYFTIFFLNNFTFLLNNNLLHLIIIITLLSIMGLFLLKNKNIIYTYNAFSWLDFYFLFLIILLF